MRTESSLPLSRVSFRVGLAAALALLLAASACSSKTAGKTEPGEEDIGGISDADLQSDSSRFGSGNIPLPQAGEPGGPFADIPFDYDSSAVAPEYHQQLRDAARTLSKDPSLRTEVEGHCDKRGTNEYNMALGQQRAKAVAALLTSFGASPDQISTVSYGEEIPLDPSESESAYARNRRVHFALFRAKDGGGSAADRY